MFGCCSRVALASRWTWRSSPEVPIPASIRSPPGRRDDPAPAHGPRRPRLPARVPGRRGSRTPGSRETSGSPESGSSGRSLAPRRALSPRRSADRRPGLRRRRWDIAASQPRTGPRSGRRSASGGRCGQTNSRGIPTVIAKSFLKTMIPAAHAFRIHDSTVPQTDKIQETLSFHKWLTAPIHSGSNGVTPFHTNPCSLAENTRQGIASVQREPSSSPLPDRWRAEPAYW